MAHKAPTTAQVAATLVLQRRCRQPAAAHIKVILRQQQEREQEQQQTQAHSLSPASPCLQGMTLSALTRWQARSRHLPPTSLPCAGCLGRCLWLLVTSTHLWRHTILSGQTAYRLNLLIGAAFMEERMQELQ